MSDGNGGFILPYRSLLDHTVFRTGEEAMFFAYLVLKANWKPGERRYEDRIYNLERGDLVVGMRALADEYGWSQKRVRTQIKRHSDCGMLSLSWAQHGAHRASVITICNYDKFQLTPADGAQGEARLGAQGGHSKGTPKNKGNKGKERKPTTGADPSLSSSATQCGGQKESSGNHQSAEDEFWALADRAQAAKITRSLMGKLAKAVGDFDEAYPALATALGKDNPAAYVSGIIRKRERESAAASAGADPNTPAIVREAQQSGQAVEALPEGRWRIAGAIYDAEGQEVGW